ncbi:MAG: hypothetical protein ACYSX0_04085 [Planctomycetota bacterium]|jgi:hypothetical protein
MRALTALLLAAIAATAGENLLPREGSGWEGFQVGSWVKMKRSFHRTGGVPVVALITMRLDKRTDAHLSLQTVTRNAVGMETKTTQPLPRRGEAGKGEKAKTETLKDETVVACGKSLPCSRTRTTITGPNGKRVVTEWRAKQPLVRVKRTEATYDKDGKLLGRLSMVLTSLDNKQDVGKRRVRCLAYSTQRKRADGMEERGKAFVSRAVPGYTVRMDTEIVKGGQVIWTARIHALDFEAK